MTRAIEWHREDCWDRDCEGQCHEVECLSCGEVFEDTEVDWGDSCPECGELLGDSDVYVDEERAERQQMGITSL